MAEFFDIITRDGQETGQKKARDAVHRDGDWHKSVHVWLFADGKFLLQKRKEDKESFPSMWDAACTGHVDAGETYLQGALRELKEELGLTVRRDQLDYIAIQDLCVIGSWGANGAHSTFTSNERCCIYLLRLDETPKITFQAEEISCVKWFDKAACDHLIGDVQCCIKPDEYKKVKCYLTPEITAICPGDEKELYSLFYDTVHEICKRDYSRAERDAWAPDAPDLPAWSARFGESTTLCVRADGRIAAFGNIYENGDLDCLYVHKDFVGCSLGRRLLHALENACPASVLHVRVSLFARRFFERNGYTVTKEVAVSRRGCKLVCFEMEKRRTM